MKVGIFETDHFEVAYTVIKLFDIPANRLVIFTTAATYKRLTDLLSSSVNRYEWVILDTTGSRLAFFNQLYTEAKSRQLDLFYINTISNNHLLYARIIDRLKVPRVVLTVHDINCLFESTFSLHPKKLAHHIGKKRLVKQVQEFNVISDTMIDYLTKKTGGKKKVHNLPGAIFQQNHVPAEINDYIRLVIPGSIDKKRRDYALVFELAQLADEKKLPLHLVILGGYTDDYGREVYKRAAAYTSLYVQLKCYDTDIVEQDEFDKQLNAAHFILIPSVINTAICFDIPEVYGITKSSGNIFDVVKHAKPFIIPQQLTIPASLESSGYRYNSAAPIIELMASLLSEKTSYNKWEQQAVANSMAYTIDSVRAKNAKLVQG